MLFSDIPGLTDLKQHLRDAADKGAVAHAQMLVGKPGSANLALALAYATYVNSTHYQEEAGLFGASEPQKPNADGVVNGVFEAFRKLTHPDLYFIVPTTTTSKITKTKDAISENFQEDFRSFVRSSPFGTLADWSRFIGAENKQAIIRKEESRFISKSLAVRNYEAPFKTVVVWLPELMQAPAANALLKLLEEPNGKTLFLLVSESRDQLLPTILSRVQQIEVPEVEEADLVSYLEIQGIPQPRIAKAARRAQGNFRRARELATHDEGDFDTLFMDWLRDCYRNDFVDMRSKSQVIASLSKAQQVTFFTFSLHTFERILLRMYQEGGEVVDPLDQFIEKFSQVIGYTAAIQIIDCLTDTLNYLDRNANPRMAAFVLSLSISSAFKIKD